MPMSLSELLNPVPGAGHSSNQADDVDGSGRSAKSPAISATHAFFAPELFQSSSNEQEPTNGVRYTADSERDAGLKHSLTSNSSESPVVQSQTKEIPQYLPPTVAAQLPPTVQATGIAITEQEHESTNTSNITAGPVGTSFMADRQDSATEDAENNDTGGPDVVSKSRTKSSSKNEGQHTDKRYLCYVCNKLFTRRRSVRDHINKIHNSKTWEPNRSLEIIVDPTTGEPVEPLEKQLYKVAARPPPGINETSQNEDLGQPSDPGEARDSSPIEKLESLAPSTTAKIKKEESRAASREPSQDSFATPTRIVGKKRPAPGSSATAGALKKTTARAKNVNPHKKPKLATAESLLERSPSITPNSLQPKHPGSKLKKQSSFGVRGSPSPSALSRDASVDVTDDEEEDLDDEHNIPDSAADTPQTTNSDGEVFCICRKGDNHTWMIACDGGCEEWFHGRCVDIRERDGDLIDKYLCPKCQAKGVGQTTWKRMCRRKDCRKPARVLDLPPSKYCSPECGRKFFVELVMRGDDGANINRNGQYIHDGVKRKKNRRKHRLNRDSNDVANGYPEQRRTPISEEERSEYETDSSADEEDLPNRGGTLRAGEIRAMLDQCRSIVAWRDLGKKPLSPPESADLNDTADGKMNLNMELEVSHDQFEKQELSRIQADIDEGEHNVQTLNSKERFFGLIKDRSAKIIEDVKKTNPKMKDVCGYDPRLSWTKEEFHHWSCTEDGKATLDGTAKLGPPPSKGDIENNVLVNGVEHDDDDPGSEDDDPMPTKGGVCIKNRCARHGKWGKMQLAEVRFDQDLAMRRIEKLKREQEALRGRAVVRAWERRT